MAIAASSLSSASSDFADAFPCSRKVFAEGKGVRVPMREITLSDGEPALRVYDTSGPHDTDIRSGLPPHTPRRVLRYCGVSNPLRASAAIRGDVTKSSQ